MALGNFRPGSARLQEYLSTLVDDFFHLDSQTHPLLALTRMLHPFTHRSSDIQQFPDYFQRQQRRQNQIHMRDCLELAREALAKDPKMEKSEPVACIITDRDGKMLTQAVNIKKDGMFEHAEMLALRELVRQNHGHLPYGIKLYVTMEPCMECWSQMRRAGWVPEVLVYASKTRLGAFSNHFDTREGYHELMKPDFQSPSVKNANIRQARENQARIFYHEKVNWKGTVI
jgi:tRNA(Arg) A34 adenosine deaminase TadA